MTDVQNGLMNNLGLNDKMQFLMNSESHAHGDGHEHPENAIRRSDRSSTLADVNPHL
jgi:hypothetical protein